MNNTVQRIALLAFVTFIEAFLAVIVAAGTTNLDASTAQLGLVGGLAAVASLLYNLARSWLAEQQPPGLGGSGG